RRLVAGDHRDAVPCGQFRPALGAPRHHGHLTCRAARTEQPGQQRLAHLPDADYRDHFPDLTRHSCTVSATLTTAVARARRTPGSPGAPPAAAPGTRTSRIRTARIPAPARRRRPVRAVHRLARRTASGTRSCPATGLARASG